MPAATAFRRHLSTALTSAALLWLLPQPGTAQSIVLAQAGSTGGSIGRHGKEATGSDEPRPRHHQTPRVERSEHSERTASKGCPSIVGRWSSWASGMFGANDTVFKADGTAYHSAGITGRWFCENGQLRIEWPDGKPGAVKLSADGKQIIDSAGGVHMSR
ncbi:MAG TPA: hypothetical protein VFB45_00730 [Pseudolabrys sp.]|nr:hypothetical protein [Pseudolabrys sp.]